MRKEATTKIAGEGFADHRTIMEKIVSLYKSLINYGIDESWDLDKKRSYRQVNEFNLFLTFIALSAFPIALFYKVYLGFLVQIAGFTLYLSTFYFISRGQLNTARRISIYTFEAHMFIVSLFAVLPTHSGILPWYSPVFVAYMLYPLVAALYDKSVFKHTGIAFLQILLIQFVVYPLTKLGLNLFPHDYYDILNIIVCVYVIGMTTLIIYIVYSENYAVKVQQKEHSRQLEAAIKESKTSRSLLQKQTKELEEANESKNKFFSIIAHDLKSPFNVLLGFSEVLKEKNVSDPECHQYAKQIYDTALMNYNLLENLLEWSRTQMEHIQFVPVDFDIISIIEKNIDLVKISAEKKEIEIENRIKKINIVNADINLVNTIIRNLLGNAIKYTNTGGKVIIDSVVRKGFLEISVKDNGIGISKERLKTLFMLEKKQSRRGTSSETGTGLGLILCKEFVKMHGGEIHAESTENAGSTFYFTLPLAIDKEKVA